MSSLPVFNAKMSQSAASCLQGGGYLALSGIPHNMLLSKTTALSDRGLAGAKALDNPSLYLEQQKEAAMQDEATLDASGSNVSAQCKFDLHIVFHRSYQQPVLFFRAYNGGEPQRMWPWPTTIKILRSPSEEGECNYTVSNNELCVGEDCQLPSLWA